jgi:hypothetical protein
MGSGEISPLLYRPTGRLCISLRALTCEFSSPFKIGRRMSFHPLSCGEVNSPLRLRRVCPRGRTCRSAFGPKSLKDSVQLTWHARLNCQRAWSPAEGRVPQLGKVGKLALEASLVCLAGLSSTYSVGSLACRAIFNSTQAWGTCQGFLQRHLASTFSAHASTSPTAEHLPACHRAGGDLRYKQGFAVELGRCREPVEGR